MIRSATQRQLPIGVISLFFLVSLCAWAATPHAAADTLPEKAREAMARGLAAAKLKDYELALKYLKSAYDSGGKESRDVVFNLALAYDRAGGRELLAIVWYRSFLGLFADFQERKIRDERVAKVKQRVIELDIQVESVVMRLIKAAREMSRGESMRTAEALAAIGAFDAAAQEREAALGSHRALFQKVAEEMRSRGEINLLSESFTPNILSIALSQWKHGDSRGAIHTVDWALSPRIAHPFPEYHGQPYLYQAVQREPLEQLRRFVNRDWDGFRMHVASFFRSPENEAAVWDRRILNLASTGKLGDFFSYPCWPQRGGTICSVRESTVDRFERSLFMIRSSRYDILPAEGVRFGFSDPIKITLDKGCWNESGVPSEYWPSVAHCTLFAGWSGGFSQDWRLLAEKEKGRDLDTAVRGIAGLARDMAQVLHFVRMLNAYRAGDEVIGWVWR